jgi:hypothetical protein
MAFQINNTIVIDNDLNLQNIANRPAWVALGNAALPAGGVGTYCFAATTQLDSVDNFGATRAGSSLTPQGVTGEVEQAAPRHMVFRSVAIAALPGTWRAMGTRPPRVANSNLTRQATLYLRIS